MLRKYQSIYHGRYFAKLKEKYGTSMNKRFLDVSLVLTYMRMYIDTYTTLARYVVVQCLPPLLVVFYGTYLPVHIRTCARYRIFCIAVSSGTQK